jgi:hypothetical protein
LIDTNQITKSHGIMFKEMLKKVKGELWKIKNYWIYFL